MKLIKVTEIDQIKKGDTLIITGDTLVNKSVTVEMVKKSNNDGTEIIFNLKKNRYFNLRMYLDGESWVKDLAIIK